MKKITFSILLVLFSFTGFAQTLLKGRVVSEDKLPLPGVNITIQGSPLKTITDFEGQFSIVPIKKKPIVLEAFYYGYQTTVLEFMNSDSDITIVLKKANRLDEVVISASRNEERIFESPVSVERFGKKQVKKVASADFYDGLQSLKGIDINTNSLTNKSINARGFNSFSNNRFVQLVDGMDNASPSLNFVMGNLLGLSELDVESIEVLPGASSALYGANAFNGILFMNSKNPFDYQGVSAYLKTGVTSQDAAGTNLFNDYGVRLAHAFGDKLAVKANVSYLKGTDWHATNYDNQNNPGTDRFEPGYDGVNVYGDSFEDIIGNTRVTRTGYNEVDLIKDFTAESFKVDGALHYRPFGDDFEVIYNAKYGEGSTLIGASNRIAVRDFSFFQNKVEIKNDNFFLRGYITQEDSGNTTDLALAATAINNLWKNDNQWSIDYALGYRSIIPVALDNTATLEQKQSAHNSARNFADAERILPGTEVFNSFLEGVSNSSSRYISKSQIRHADANYNFSHLTKEVVDVQVGGSFRQYKLDSKGTAYTDFDGPIKYNEYGIYTQLQKKIFDKRLKLTGSIRYDKSELFEGNFSPRFSAGYTFGGKKNHNIRASFQTAFRNPTTQDLFLGVDVGGAVLAGSANANLDKEIDVITLAGTSDVVTIREAYENSFTSTSVKALEDQISLVDGDLSQVDFSVLEVANVDPVTPERVQSYELGYRANVGNFTIDLSGYFSEYWNFITTESVVSPGLGNVNNFDATQLPQNLDTQLIFGAYQANDLQVFQVYTNSDKVIDVYGFTTSVETKIFKNFDLGVNYTFADLETDEKELAKFQSGFNTPKHTVKASFGNEQLFENFGFNTNLRWTDKYFWTSPIARGEIPSYTVIDAQVNYTIPNTKLLLKLGGTNLTGKEYFSGLGSGAIGSTYYIGVTFNNL